MQDERIQVYRNYYLYLTTISMKLILAFNPFG